MIVSWLSNQPFGFIAEGDSSVYFPLTKPDVAGAWLKEKEMKENGAVRDSTTNLASKLTLRLFKYMEKLLKGLILVLSFLKLLYQ